MMILGFRPTVIDLSWRKEWQRRGSAKYLRLRWAVFSSDWRDLKCLGEFFS
jgi:hypothetical protein